MTDVEAQVISTFLNWYDDDAVRTDLLNFDDFETSEGRKLFEIILDTEKANGSVDIALIDQYLRDKVEHLGREGKEIGDREITSTAPFIEILNKAVSPSNFSVHVDRLKKGRQRRDTVRLFQSAIRDLNGTANEAVIERVQNEIKRIYSGNEKYDFNIELYDVLENLEERRRKGVEMPTGFHAFNSAWGGLMRKEMHVIAGDSGHFKTTLTLNLVLKPLADGKRVMWFDREMGKQRILSHYMSIVAKMPTWKLRKASFTDDDYEKFVQTAAEIAEQQFIVMDDVSTLEKMNENVYRYSPDIVVIDNFQNMDFPKSDNFWTFHMGIVRCKDLAMDHNVALVGLSQVTRTAQDVRSAKAPTLENLFGSRAIKMNADVISIVHWKWKDLASTGQLGKTEQQIAEVEGIKHDYDIYHAKMREEGLQMVTMRIEPEFGRVYDLTKRTEERDVF